MTGTLSLGRIRGVLVEVDWGWLVVLPLLFATLATGWFPDTTPDLNVAAHLTLAFIGVLLYVGAVALHEIGHAVAAHYQDLTAREMTLYFFGGVSDLERDPRRPGAEAWVALGGPIASLFIGALAGWIGALLTNPNLPALNDLGSNLVATSLLRYVEYTNVLLGLFNLLPAYPLDGGWALRAVVWRNSGNLPRATRMATLIGQVLGYTLIVLGVTQFFSQNTVSGLWVGAVGALLLAAAQAERGRTASVSILAGALVEDAMAPIKETIPPDLSVKRLMEEHVAAGARALPVVDGDGALLGLATQRDAQATPRQRWDATPVRDVMVPLSELHVVGQKTPLEEALPLLAERDVNQAPVVQEGRLVGMLNRESILRYLVGQRRLSSAEAERELEEELPATP
jgi:Zn-dependent protease/predicted transcriptional regulator